MIFLALTLPGLVVAYFLYVRPILRALPQLKKFYAQADSVHAKVWAIFGKSATLVWGVFLQVLSWALQLLDPVASALGDPELRQQITDGLSADPKILGYILMAISFVTIAARLRNFAKEV